MEVVLKRSPADFIYWPMAIITLGLFPLLVNMGQRHFVRLMEAQGVTTRGGRHILWTDITSVERVKTVNGSTVFSYEYIFHSRHGKASLPLWRMANAEHALQFMSLHLRSEAPQYRQA